MYLVKKKKQQRENILYERSEFFVLIDRKKWKHTRSEKKRINPRKTKVEMGKGKIKK